MSVSKKIQLLKQLYKRNSPIFYNIKEIEKVMQGVGGLERGDSIESSESEMQSTSEWTILSVQSLVQDGTINFGKCGRYRLYWHSSEAQLALRIEALEESRKILNERLLQFEGKMNAAVEERQGSAEWGRRIESLRQRNGALMEQLQKVLISDHLWYESREHMVGRLQRKTRRYVDKIVMMLECLKRERLNREMRRELSRLLLQMPEGGGLERVEGGR